MVLGIRGVRLTTVGFRMVSGFGYKGVRIQEDS